MFFSSQRTHELEALIAALDKSQAVIQFNMDGTIITANQNFLDALGYRLDEIQGKHHSMFVDPAFAKSAEYQGFWDALRRGEYQAAEYKRIGKGGKEVWIQASYNPIMDASGKPYKVVKFATDTTQAKLQNADYLGQINAIGKAQAVIQFKLDGTILTANQNFLDALGYRLEEIQGKHHSMFVDSAFAKSHEYQAFWDALRRGEYQAAEYKRIGKGGKEVWIQASYNPIFDMSGKPFKVVKFATDITKQVKKRAETEAITKYIIETLDTTGAAISGATGTAAAASHQTAATVQAVASGAEELNSSIKEIARSMNLSKASVDEAMRQTETADQSTQQLTRAAESMTGIVELIQDIASQINLLSLNATIESARAGEAGKGFAVVANEVKNLAAQAKSATDKISEEIGNMQQVSGNVVTSLSAIKQSIESVLNSVTGVAGAIEEQSAVSSEISSNMQTASSSVDSINSSVKDIAEAVEESNRSSDKIKANLEALNAA